MAISKKRALSIVFSAAESYSENLSNRTILLLGMDRGYRVRPLEVSFSEGNFCHLTGMKTELSSRNFFGKCLDRRLRETDFRFSNDGTTELKLQVLPNVVKRDLSARMMGEYNNANIKLYTEMLAGGAKACLGFKRISDNGIYVPNTLLREDVRKLTAGKPDRIILTCSKGINDPEYSDVVFQAEGINWERVVLPDEFKYLRILKQ